MHARRDSEAGDATKTRFEDDSYDMAISTGAMHHWKHPEKVIDEMCRVLRPGGEACRTKNAQKMNSRNF
ncbi:MAG: class I SAM-dependent methyltransferase [Planctomycetota bacterium]